MSLGVENRTVVTAARVCVAVTVPSTTRITL